MTDDIQTAGPDVGRSAVSRGLDRFASGLEALANVLNVVILTAIILVIFVSVVLRYGFSSGMPWSEEFAIWGFTWLIFTGVALGVRKGRHVAVDILIESLPAASRSIAEFLRDALVVLALISLVMGGLQLAQMVGGVSTSLQWPNWVRYAIIPSAGGLALVFLLLEDTRLRMVLRRGAAIALGVGLHLMIQYPALAPFGNGAASLAMILVFFGALLLGVPVAFAMVLGVVMTTWTGGLLPTPAIMQNMVAGSSKFILLAIPFFLTTGYLLNIGGLSNRLIDFASALFGHFRGGLAQVNVFNSVLVGGISGSSGADAASTTKVLVPQMVARGYAPGFACAVTAASSILPNVLPPAIAMLVYASVSNVSIAKLFVAGILPGLLIAAALMVCNTVIARKRGYEEAGTRASCAVVRRTFLRALPALVIAVVVLGCIRFGITTATEAGVMALVWAFILGKFVFREYSWRQLGESLAECCVDSALIGFLIAASVPFAWILIAEGLPQQLVGLTQDYALGPMALILVVVVTLFVAGMFLDLTPAILIAAPLFLPLLTAAGFDPVQVGIIMIINLQLGGVTPPVGILVFITAQISRTSPQAVFREVIPFAIAIVIVLALVCAVPALTLGLWSVLG